ncbi:MAG: rhodanese-like domain-containing protein [Acidobacteriota bacterium]
MLFESFTAEGLAHYSYAVGCQASKEMAIVDPQRDVDGYLAFAHAKGMRITHVLETHIHADFASGARELAERTGATVYESTYDAGETFEIDFPHRDLADGDEVRVGNLRIRALHTPGHTPEHLSFLVFDETRSVDVPMMMLTGDFLFVGSLGRPDLLGEEAKRALANQLFDSVRQVLPALPDGLEIYPAHGAGSMCGSGMSGRPMTTLGFERLANPYLDPALDRETFVARVLGSVPPFPPYYRRMKALNSAGAKSLGADALPGEALDVDGFQRAMENGAVVVDLRDQHAFGGDHIVGSLGIPFRDDLSVWTSWMVPYETPILLVTADERQLEPAIRRLVRVGLDEVAGWLDGGIATWRERGLPMTSLEQITPAQLEGHLDEVTVLDARENGEWDAGHLRGAHHIPAHAVLDRIDEVRALDGPIAVMCGSGYRSTVAASQLQRAGIGNLLNVTGGMNAWRALDLPVVKPTEATA